MPVKSIIQEIPVFQSADQLIAFLLEEFMFMYAMDGIVLLTNDDLRVLADTLQRFMNNSARSKSQSTTDTMKEDN